MKTEFTHEEKRLYAVWNCIARLTRTFPFQDYGFTRQPLAAVCDEQYPAADTFVRVCGCIGILINPLNKYRVDELVLFQHIERAEEFALDFLEHLRSGNPTPQYDIVAVTVKVVCDDSSVFFCHGISGQPSVVLYL